MDCRDLCKQKRIEDNCGCYFPRLLIISRNNSCVTAEEFKCVDKQFESANYDEFNNECNELCPLECDKMIFSTVYSQSNHFTKEYDKSMMKREIILNKFSSNNSGIDEENLERSILRMSIFYDSLSLIEVTEYPSFSLLDLISNMGGTIGLFLGMSVLSFIEIVEIVYEMLIFLIRKK